VNAKASDDSTNVWLAKPTKCTDDLETELDPFGLSLSKLLTIVKNPFDRLRASGLINNPGLTPQKLLNN
jgi:hypothetical protein